MAGVTSFWGGDALLRAVSFAIFTLVACFLAHSHSALPIVSLVAVTALWTVFAPFPRPATAGQLARWAAAAPLASLVVALVFRAWKGSA